MARRGARGAASNGQLVVVKIGTSSVTLSGEPSTSAHPPASPSVHPPASPSARSTGGLVNTAALAKLIREIAEAKADGYDVVVVTSGAITAGVARLGIDRPTQPERLQAVSAVGQIDLMATYAELFARHGLIAGQVLIAPHDFADRSQYVHARSTFEHLLRYGVVPVVNENDAVADDAIRYGDNDRIAALVANLLNANLLVLLTDTEGVLSADPRRDAGATLVEEIREFEEHVEAAAGKAGAVGSGGMMSKMAAAKMAAWSGVRSVIAAAGRPDVLRDAIAGTPGVGTRVEARDAKVTARRLWIGFAVATKGTLTVDDGARKALVGSGRSLLSAGVVAVDGTFGDGDAVDVAGPDGEVFAKGLASMPAEQLVRYCGKRSDELPVGISPMVVHRDDLVVLTSAGSPPGSPPGPPATSGPTTSGPGS